jgi:broad specificity phosphatase PhoE
MGSTWERLGADLTSWRRELLEALTGLDEDSVVVTHFIAINVVVGAASGDPRVVCVAPDNGSRTVVDADPAGLRVVHLGAQARTAVG